MSKKILKQVSKELKNVSKMHKGQANRIDTLLSNGSPVLKKLSSSCKAAARAKFDVYPSAYANIWASKQQKAGKC